MKTELHHGQLSAGDFRFALVVSRWNHDLTSRLASGALEALIGAGATAESVVTFNVPGAFELPLTCLKVAQTGDFDAVIALGAVVRGGTPHFEYVCGQAAAGVLQASMQSGVPVLFGVITAETMDQAEARAGQKVDNKGYEAALAAVEMVNLFREMNSTDEQGGGEERVFPHVV